MEIVIGKVCRDLNYPSICDWVIRTDDNIVTGSCTVFHSIGGYRFGTMSESRFNQLVKGATNQELAGRVYKVYTMKELFELKNNIQVEKEIKRSGMSLIEKITRELDGGILLCGIFIIGLLIFL